MRFKIQNEAVFDEQSNCHISSFTVSRIDNDCCMAYQFHSYKLLLQVRHIFAFFAIYRCLDWKGSTEKEVLKREYRKVLEPLKKGLTHFFFQLFIEIFEKVKESEFLCPTYLVFRFR